MAFEVPGVPDAFDRSAARPETADVIYREGNKYYAQGADLNDGFSIAKQRNQRIANQTMKDGDRIENAEALVDFDAETVRCLNGLIYIRGDIYPVNESLLEDVPMTGVVTIGVRVIETIITEVEDPALKGLQPGTAGEGERGSARRVISLAWGFSGDGQAGELYAVYRLLEGTIINQNTPTALSGIMDFVGIYDFDLNGHYIVDGCEVTALGRLGSNQLFSIKAGTANIRGYKRIRETAFRYTQLEDPALETVSGETHTFTGTTGGTTVIPVDRGPVKDVTIAIVVKRAVETVVRGNTPGGADALQMAGAFQIESVVQGTTFADTTYALAANNISWAPAGPEPTGASTYTVTYLYNVSVLDTATHTDGTISVTGGVNGKTVILGYTSKLPRIDLLCLDISGQPVYVKGLSARRGALPPIVPDNLLKLAEIYNDWYGTPTIVNNGTRNYTQDDLRRLFGFMLKMADQFDRNQYANEVRLAGTPVSKQGIFTDMFVDDFFRDQGAAQTAAVNQGVLQLAIDSVLMQVILGNVITLPFTEDIIVAQPQRTRASVINPYDNYTAFPAGMRIQPAADFWTEQQVVWTSPVTAEFTAAPNVPPGQTTFDEVASTRPQPAEFLRQIPISVTLSGFGVGEALATLTFDGVDVLTGGPYVGNSSGQITVSFTIPANTPVGPRAVRATGGAGSFASAIFVGEGNIDVVTMRRVTLVTHAAPPPITIVNNTTINNTTNVINQLANPVVTRNWWGSNNDDDSGGDADPLGQSFRVAEPRFVTGVNFWMENVGSPTNAIRVQLVTTLNGYPTTSVVADAFVSMVGVEAGDKIQARFDAPVYLDPIKLYAWVWLTADGNHAISSSRLGDIITTGSNQERVSAQPYTIGDKFTSSNRQSWLVHPDEDVAFEVVGATFTATSLVQNLWTGALSSISDLLVRGAIEVPTQDAALRYEIVRADGSIIKLTAGQTYEFAEYVSETVTLRAVLTGTDKISPVLYPGTLLAGGRIRNTGTYVTRAFQMGTSKEIDALFLANLPSGSTVTLDVDAADNTWVPLTLDSTFTVGEGWVEPKYKKLTYTASQGRVRLTLNGGPDKRVSVAALRAYTI